MRQMAKVAAWTAVAVVAAGAAAGQEKGAGEMRPPVEWANAGVKMAVPKEFEFVAPGGPAVTAVAVRRDKEGNPIQSITLGVCPAGGKTTARELADRVGRATEEGLDVRELTVVKEWDVSVAGRAGLARRMTYVNRGQKTTAVMACFLRPAEGETALGYALSVTSVPEKQGEMEGIFEAVAGSVRLTAVRGPTEAGVGPLEEAVVSRPAEYSLRRPAGWYQAAMGGAVAFGQTDWRKGAETVRAWVSVQDVEAGATAKSLAEAVMGREVKGVRREVVGRGEATMGGLKGYQFTVRISAAGSSRPATGPAGEMVRPLVVQRIVCVPGAEGKKGRCYSLFLFYEGEDVKGAEEMMAKVAAGFALVGG